MQMIGLLIVFASALPCQEQDWKSENFAGPVPEEIAKSKNGHIELINILGSRLLPKGVEPRKFWSVAFHPAGTYALSGSQDPANGSGEVKLWDVDTGNEISTWTGHRLLVRSVAFSRDGRRALSGSFNKTVGLWNVKTGKNMGIWKGHGAWVTSVVFSPDGNYALSGSYDGVLKFWDVKKGTELCSWKGHAEGVWSVAFSPDGKHALSGSRDGTVRGWHREEMQRGGYGGSVWHWKDHFGPVLSVAFSPDGKLALSGGEDGTLKLWNVDAVVNPPKWDPDSGLLNRDLHDPAYLIKPIKTFKGHREIVWSVAFSPDGKRAYSVSDDKTLKSWDVGSGEAPKGWGPDPIDKETDSIVVDGGPLSLSVNGDRVIVGNENGTITVYRVKKSPGQPKTPRERALMKCEKGYALYQGMKDRMHNRKEMSAAELQKLRQDLEKAGAQIRSGLADLESSGAQANVTKYIKAYKDIRMVLQEIK